MAIPQETRIQLKTEGMDTPEDLVDFDEDSISKISDNLRRPGGMVPDMTPRAVAGATIPTPPLTFGAKSQVRLIVACHLERFYKAVDRDTTPTNIR